LGSVNTVTKNDLQNLTCLNKSESQLLTGANKLSIFSVKPVTYKRVNMATELFK